MGFGGLWMLFIWLGRVVSIVDPIVILGVVTNAALDDVAEEARTRLLRVVAALAV